MDGRIYAVRSFAKIAAPADGSGCCPNGILGAADVQRGHLQSTRPCDREKRCNLSQERRVIERRCRVLFIRVCLTGLPHVCCGPNSRRRSRRARKSQVGRTRTSSLGAARPLPPSADIGPGGQSVGQAAQFCLGRLALQVFRIKPFGEKPESAGLAPSSVLGAVHQPYRLIARDAVPLRSRAAA